MRLTIKYRVLILALVPVIFLTALLTGYGLMQSTKLGSNAVERFANDFRESKEKELKNYIALAITSIQSYIDDPRAKTDPNIREQAYRVLRTLRFDDSGSDGYFFMYDTNGVNVMHGVNQSLEGKNLMSFQDPNGVYLIRELIEQARRGGGYVEYAWKNSDSGGTAPKLGYAVLIKEWNVMLGRVDLCCTSFVLS